MPPDQGKSWLRGVLFDIGKKRGQAASEKLLNDIVYQWNAGNRGKGDDWR